MNNSTVPVFVVGTGRNGTRSIYRMLRGTPRIEAHHEYGCENIQRVACLYSMRLLDPSTAADQVHAHYAPAINYSVKPVWLDSSNKASWIIPLLKHVFPEARFIHILRDPRRVIPSYYYKLREEMYDDLSVGLLADWIDNGCDPLKMPPSEKKYWWRLSVDKNGRIAPNERRLTRFERVCLHWNEATKAIDNSFSELDPSSRLEIRLEDLVTRRESIRALLDFLGIEESNFYYDFLQKPRNVFLPLEFNCTSPQLEVLKNICQEQSNRHGYDLSAPTPPVLY